MTNENNENQKDHQPKFLEQLYNEIRDIIKRLYPDNNSNEWSLIDDLFQIVEPYVKQSFENGINEGKRQATQDRQTKQYSQNSPSSEAEKATNRVVYIRTNPWLKFRK